MNPGYDILVAGGGVAGVPAAVSAARAGAKVILVEQGTFLGGAGVRALHRYICGLYLNGPQKPKETLNAGMAREIVEHLQQMAPSSHPMPLGRVWGHPFEPAHFREIYADMALREPNLTVLLDSKIESVQCDGNRIAAIGIRTPERSSQFFPRAAIDATGSGELIRLSGVPFELAPERQLAGMTLHLDGLVGERPLLGLKIAFQLARLPAEDYKADRHSPSVCPTPFKINELPLFAGFTVGTGNHNGFLKLSIPPPACLDQAALAARIGALHALLITHVPELAQSRIVEQSPIMEREGIRLAGISTLEEDDVLQARKHGVVRNAWPIEFWEQTAPIYAYPPDGAYYEIPRGCLQSRVAPNLFATGRCISATSRALASTRVMGTCIALGEAAGALAASFLNQHQL